MTTLEGTASADAGLIRQTIVLPFGEKEQVEKPGRRAIAPAEGQSGLYVLMLARLGQVQAAVDEGLQVLHEPSQFLALAQVLREREELAAALRVAEHGLMLEGDKGELAAWLCDLADGMGEIERALEAAKVAFREMPSRAVYQADAHAGGTQMSRKKRPETPEWQWEQALVDDCYVQKVV